MKAPLVLLAFLLAAGVTFVGAQPTVALAGEEKPATRRVAAESPSPRSCSRACGRAGLAGMGT